MRIPLKFVQLHESVIIAGTNFQKKLDTKRNESLILESESGRLFIYYKGEVAIIPEATYFNAQPVDPTILGEIPSAIPKAQPVMEAIPHRGPGRPIKAQVSTPQSHVFAGTVDRSMPSNK